MQRFDPFVATIAKLVHLACLALSLTADTGAEAPREISFDPGGMDSLQIRPLGERQKRPDDVAVAAWPAEVLDANRTHYVNQSTPTILIFAIANPKGHQVRRAWLHFSLPQGVDLLATSAYLPWHLMTQKKVERGGKAYTEYKVNCQTHPTTFPRGRGRGSWWHRYRPPALWLKTELEPGSKPGRAYYSMSYAGLLATDEFPDPENIDAEDDTPNPDTVVRSPEGWVDLAVLQKVESSPPKLASSGVMGRFTINFGLAPKMKEMVASYIRQLGYNYYVSGPPASSAPPDLHRWVEGRIQNGFDLCLTEQPPEEIRYLARNGTGTFPRAVAPWAIYNRHPWVEEHLFNFVKQSLAEGSFTTMWSNWEPYAQLKDGDFSEGSMKEFIRWSGLPGAEVREGWPDAVLKKHPLKWKTFRNWELGRIVRVLSKETSGAGSNAGFAVAMSNDAIWASIKDHGCSALDWGDMPYTLQTWQYYWVADGSGKWPVSDRSCAVQVIRSAAIARHIEKSFGRDHQVRLGCLYGHDQTGGDGYYHPEQLGFLHLSTVLAGMRNAQNYAEWPILDGRYALAMASANSRIARWERFILEGQKQRRHTVLPVSPFPQRVPANVMPTEQEPGGWGFQPVFISSYEYRKGARRVFAVANMWDFGDCFFKLRVHDLEPNQEYVLTQPKLDRVFANRHGEPSLTADELEDGVLLHVGATSWAVFALQPLDQTSEYGNPVRPETVRAAMRARRLALVEAVQKGEALFGTANRPGAGLTGAAAKLGRHLATKVARARQAVRAPTVDGELSDAAWTNGPKHAGFTRDVVATAAKYSTSWKASIHGDILYLAVTCSQDMRSWNAKATKRDGRVWLDDCVEVFVSVLKPQDGSDYFQAIVNPAGVLFDWYRKEVEWNKVIAHAVQRSPEGWQFEIGVPLRACGISPEKEAAVKVNVVRNVTDSEFNEGEVSSWYPLWGSDHADQDSRGLLLLK